MPTKRPVRITTPPPTVEEVAEIMGVSPKRTRELVEMSRRYLQESLADVGLSAPARKAAAKRAPAKKRQP